MAIYAMLGMAAVAAIFAAGATWIVRSVSFKPMKPRYESDSFKPMKTPRTDNTETNLKDEQSDPKA